MEKGDVVVTGTDPFSFIHQRVVKKSVSPRVWREREGDFVQKKARSLSVLFFAVFFGATATFFATSAGAFFRPSAEVTVGARHYVGTSVAADMGGVFHCVPAFSAYRSADSSGTYRTYSLGLFYDGSRWNWGFTGGATPEVDKYSNEFLGVESRYRFHPEGISLMAGAFRVIHSDRRQSLTQSREGPFFESDSKTDLVQTDFHGGVEIPVYGGRVHFALTDSRYGQDMGHISKTEAQKIFPRGDDFIVRGFPRRNYTLGLDFPAIAIGAPYVSFTYTRFELDALPTKILEGGLETQIGRFPVDISCELDAWGGAWSIAPYVSVRFGSHTPSIIDEKGW